MSTQPASGGDSGIQKRAHESGKTCSKADFAASLDGAQVERELNRVFRETPEFGRSLAERLVDFLNESALGSLKLIAAGGEAVVFGDDPNQSVIKFSGSHTRAGFGWIVQADRAGRLGLRPGRLVETIERFALFEEQFPSGLKVDKIGEDEEFLLMRQPFILGEHPAASDLDDWMARHGWKRWRAPSELESLQTLSWRRAGVLATDVRPENAIVAEADGQIYPIDFIVSRVGSIPS